MARSPQYWYDYMVGEKNTNASLNNLQPNIDTNQDLLNDLTTPSKVADWRLWLWVVATCAHTLDVVFDLLLITFEALAQRSRFGTLPWYVQKAFEFQYGDTLVYQNNEFQYPAVNTTNRIIERAAAKEAGNTVNVKIAKLVAGIPTKLNPTEKTAATAYFQKIKPAGVDVNVISDDPDEIRIYYKVYIDPLLLDLTGQLLTTPGVYPVEDAVSNYFSAVEFNGKLEVSDLNDKIQTATGVVSPYLIAAYGRYGANPFLPFTERYYPNAGHMKIDPTTPLNTTIIYAVI